MKNDEKRNPVGDELEKLKKEWAPKIALSAGGDAAAELFLRRLDIIAAVAAEETEKLRKNNASLRDEIEILRGLVGEDETGARAKMLSLVEENKFLREGLSREKSVAVAVAEDLARSREITEAMKRDALLIEDVHKKELARLREIIADAENKIKDIDAEWKKKYDAASSELASQKAIYHRRLESASSELWEFSRVVFDGWISRVRDDLGAVFGATDYISGCVRQSKTSSPGKLKKEIEPDIKLIKEKTSRMVDMFNKMAEFFSVRPEFKKTDPNSVFRRVKERYSRLFGLNVKWPAEAEYPPLVCDETLVAEALTELAANSIDALGGEDARSGSVEVAVSVDDTFITVTVSDSGPGVPEENEDRLFTPFFTTKPGRDGLGLVRAKRNILFHGGEIFRDKSGFKFRISHE